MSAVGSGRIGTRFDRASGTAHEAGAALLADGLMDEGVAPRRPVWSAMQTLPAVLMLLLVVLQLSFGAGTSQICARLENVPCGP